MKQFTGNPRIWTDKERAKLKANLEELGDISGIVHDENSNEIPCGNFRSDIINIINSEIEIVKEFDKPDAQGTVALGFVIWEGNRYNYRRVQWTREQCEKACLTANALGGDWDYEALMSGDWDVELLKLCNLDVKEETSTMHEDLSDKLQEEFKLEITLSSESEQEELFNELEERGYQCRVLTL